MTPPSKVYEKRKRSKGDASQQAEPKKLTPRKKKTKAQSTSNPLEIQSSDTQPVTTPLPTLQTNVTNPTSDPIQPIPFPNLELTPENAPMTSTEPQSEPTTAAIMQMIREINEGVQGEEENENREELNRGAGEGEQEEVGQEFEVEEENEEEAFDNFRFSNGRAEKDFGKYWINRSVIVERGMELSHFQTEEFQLKQNFEKRGWIKWAQFSGVAVAPIVREFYANMTGIQFEGKDCILTKVRGIFFKIYPKDIRKFFDLKEEKHPQFPFAHEEALDKDALAKILTGKPSAEWGHKKKLAKNRLSSKYNSLHFLACSQLNPALNTSEISYERGLLLYAIDQGFRVELGKLIWDSIAAMIKIKKGVSGLPFAGFVTKYVCKKKVIAELGEQVVKPLGPITASSRERSASHKKAKEGATLEEFMVKMDEKWDEVRVTLGGIENSQNFLKERILAQDKRIAAMEAKLDLLISSTAVGPSTIPSEDPPFES